MHNIGSTGAGYAVINTKSCPGVSLLNAGRLGKHLLCVWNFDRLHSADYSIPVRPDIPRAVARIDSDIADNHTDQYRPVPAPRYRA